jgi:hypothetical protein
MAVETGRIGNIHIIKSRATQQLGRTMKEGITVFILTVVTDPPASRSGRFASREEPTNTHYTGGQVGCVADLDVSKKRKMLHCRDSNHNFSDVWL